MAEPEPQLFERRPYLAPAEAVGLFMACAMLFLAAGPTLAPRGAWGFLALEVLAFAAPPLVLARLRGTAREILRLEPPSARIALGTLLVGLSVWAVVAFLVLPIQERLMPAPAALTEGLRQAIVPSGTSLLVVLVTSALGPGICEELLCRGALAPALERALGRVPAIGLSAALFALLHMSPYRLLPTFALGVILGALALRSRSTLAAIGAHALSNAAILGIELAPPGVTAWVAARPTLLGALALGPLGAGLWLARRD